MAITSQKKDQKPFLIAALSNIVNDTVLCCSMLFLYKYLPEQKLMYGQHAGDHSQLPISRGYHWLDDTGK